MGGDQPKHGVLVAVDGSETAQAAVEWAAHEALLRNTPLTLAYVIEPVVVSWPVRSFQGEFNAWQESNAREALEKAEQTARSVAGADWSALRTAILRGYVVQELVTASRAAALLVVGSRGLGAVGRAVLGSVSSGALRHAHCPVAVVRPDTVADLDRSAPVLLGIDGSPASEGATRLAFEEAALRKVDLVALHAWSDVAVLPAVADDWDALQAEGRAVLDTQLAPHRDRHPEVTVHTRIVCDRPSRWLIDESRNAQLVVVGSRGRGGFAGLLLGSVASAVAQSADAPVIVVRERAAKS